jgi:transposase-like protein
MTREYTPEVKAAVMAALLAGQSGASVAKEFGIPRGTVSAWRARKVQPIIEGAAADATQKRQDEINVLLLDLVIAQLKSQIALADHTTNKVWLMQQDASALGLFMGIENDKLFRLVQALNNERPDPEPAQT